MPMSLIRTQKLHAPLLRPVSSRGGQGQPALLWAIRGAGICIALLNMLSLLPCVSHCMQDETRPGACSLCNLRDEPKQRSSPSLLVPHHHAAPRVPFEPLLVQMGLLPMLLLLVSRLFVSASHTAPRPISAPPTPPPRAI